MKTIKLSKKDEFNIFIRDYDTIRESLALIYMYGCYSHAQLSEITNVSNTKIRDNIKRTQYFIGEDFQSHQRDKNATIFSLKWNRYDPLDDFLIKTYRTKSFSEQEINLYFFILQILGDEYLKIAEIITIIQDNYFENSNNDEITHKMMSNFLNKMCEIGIVVKSKDKPAKYKLSFNIIEVFETEELNIIMNALYLFRQITPITVPAYFIQDSIKNYIEDIRDDYCEDNNIFLFKHIFLHNILNDELIYKIVLAIEERLQISCKYNDFDTNTETQYNLIPLKIIIDQMYGRQYLLCFNLNENRARSYNISSLNGISILTEKYNLDEYHDSLSLIYNNWSTSRLNLIDDPLSEPLKLVEIEFYVKDVPWIKTRLEKEKKMGVIKLLQDDILLFSAEVLQPIEMIPWIRSFGEYAKVRESRFKLDDLRYHDIDLRIAEDWRGALEKYGII